MKQFLQNESGQGMVEYALIIALIALVAVAALSLFGTKVGDFYNNFGQQIDAVG